MPYEAITAFATLAQLIVIAVAALAALVQPLAG